MYTCLKNYLFSFNDVEKDSLGNTYVNFIFAIVVKSATLYEGQVSIIIILKRE